MTTSKKKSRKSSKISKYMLAPFRALIRARDMYVSTCTGRIQTSRVSGSRVPRSQSHSFYNSRIMSGENDVKDLIRAASQGTLGSLNSAKDHLNAVPRSQSVAVGVGISKIDEDKASDFSDDFVMFPKSNRSYGMGQNRRIRVLA